MSTLAASAAKSSGSAIRGARAKSDVTFRRQPPWVESVSNRQPSVASTWEWSRAWLPRCAPASISRSMVSGINGIVRRYLINNVVSPHSALDPLMQSDFFDACETNALIELVARGGSSVVACSIDQLIDSGSKGVYRLSARGEEDEQCRERLLTMFHLTAIVPFSVHSSSPAFIFHPTQVTPSPPQGQPPGQSR